MALAGNWPKMGATPAMKAFPWQLRGLFILVFLGWSTISRAERELHLTGSYEDAGTIVTAAPDQSTVVSLHAMLSLEFVPGLARILHDRTAEVRLFHEVGALRVEVVDRDDEVIWRATWKQGEGFSLRDGRAVLHFKPGRFGNDEYVVVLSTVTEHRLLQLEMRRMKPTFFGPVFEPMGTYLFHRL